MKLTFEWRCSRGIVTKWRKSNPAGNPILKKRMEHRAFAYGRAAAWPTVARRVIEVMPHVIGAGPTSSVRVA